MKKLIAFILGFILLFSNVPLAFAQSTLPQIVSDDVASGIVSVQYPREDGQKVKVLIEKDNEKYQYTLSASKQQESFPLQMGSGIYTVTVLENVVDNRYKVLMSETIQVNISDNKQAFLQSVQGMEWNDSMQAIQKAKSLTTGLVTDEEKVKAIYGYIVKNFSYDNEKIGTLTTDYLPDVEKIFTEKKGICYDYASLAAVMLRSAGIPTKMVKGYTTNALGYHAWNEVYLNGQWMTVDTSYDSQMGALGKNCSMIKDKDIYDEKYEY